MTLYGIVHCDGAQVDAVINSLISKTTLSRYIVEFLYSLESDDYFRGHAGGTMRLRKHSLIQHDAFMGHSKILNSSQGYIQSQQAIFLLTPFLKIIFAYNSYFALFLKR